MPELSIIIPSRSEMFLAKTIEDILANIESDTEIIVVLDGNLAEPPIPRKEKGLIDASREPLWSRKLGHDSGKSKSKLPKKYSEWKLEYPNIDIRHKGTITKRKCRLDDFKHNPNNRQETTFDKIPGWNL